MISDFFKQVNKLFSRRRVNVYESIETRDADRLVYHSWSFFLPCLWYYPILVDRHLLPGSPINWEEYTPTLHPLPGHTNDGMLSLLNRPFELLTSFCLTSI